MNTLVLAFILIFIVCSNTKPAGQDQPNDSHTDTSSQHKSTGQDNSNEHGSGYGSGSQNKPTGQGYPSDNGSGYGSQSGQGYPSDNGSGYGSQSGQGYPSDHGSGYGSQSGQGYPSDNGSGSASGYGSGSQNKCKDDNGSEYDCSQSGQGYPSDCNDCNDCSNNCNDCSNNSGSQNDCTDCSNNSGSQNDCTDCLNDCSDCSNDCNDCSNNSGSQNDCTDCSNNSGSQNDCTDCSNNSGSQNDCTDCSNGCSDCSNDCTDCSNNSGSQNDCTDCSNNCNDCIEEPEQYLIQPSTEMPQSSNSLANEVAKILSMVDLIAYELNNLFNDTVTVNASIRAKVNNNVVTLYIDITFQNSNVSADTIATLCQALKGQLQPVSNMQFQQCILPVGTRYAAGNTVTMQLQSEPMNNDNTGGATGLISSFVVIGFSYLLHFLFKNL